MPVGAVTVRQAKRAWVNGLYERLIITNATLSAGQDDGVSVSSGNIAELATAEVGEDGELDDYVAVVIGQFPFPITGESTRAKPTIDIQNGTPADVPSETMANVGGKKGAGRGEPISRWVNEDDYSSVSKIDRDPLEPKRPFVLDGQDVVVLARNESSSFTPSFSDSTYELTLMVWDGEGAGR